MNELFLLAAIPSKHQETDMNIEQENIEQESGGRKSSERKRLAAQIASPVAYELKTEN
jgi:hypothetical protein